MLLNRNPIIGVTTVMAPTPLQKTPQISPIFISDKVTLHVSRERTRKMHLVDAGWDDTKVVQPDGCGQGRRVDPTPPAAATGTAS